MVRGKRFHDSPASTLRYRPTTVGANIQHMGITWANLQAADTRGI